MQEIKFGHMQFIHWNKITTTILALAISLVVMSQENSVNLEDHDNHKLYFGIQLGANSSNYKFLLSEYYPQQDFIQTIESQNKKLIHLGLLANWNISDRFDLRFYPLNLLFSDKKILYTTKYKVNDADLSNVYENKIESIVMSFPLQVRLKSDRINNFRFYSLAGLKMDYAMSFNSSVNGDNNFDIKAKKLDYGYEAGFGFQFYFKYFIFSPEIKISNGLRNLHVNDNVKASLITDEIKSRMIMFSIHFEGGGIF